MSRYFNDFLFHSDDPYLMTEQNQYYGALTDEFIAHHGILGQKWGVRRYQNPDGSLTEEGKLRIYKPSKRLGGAEDSYNRLKRTKQTVKLSKKLEANQNKLDKATAKGDAEKITKLTEKIAAFIMASKNMSMNTSNQNENFQNQTRLFQQQMDNFQNQVNYTTMQHINTTNMMVMNSIQTAMRMSMSMY